MEKEMTKSLPITKRMVYESYLKVTVEDSSAGIDGVTVKVFNQDLRGNLYKLWNRMASGSYFPPPVREVFIPKKSGEGLRPLGLPTLSDKIGQGVVKNYLEPGLEKIFHPSSFGYRPGRDAHQALLQCKANCTRYSWIVDVDIKGFFNNMKHDILLKLVRLHCTEEWPLMYIERWLKAGVMQQDGNLVVSEDGSPQGSVISPLLSNVYLHHAFDQWMIATHGGKAFERYADDIVAHCRTKAEAERFLDSLTERMKEFGLELHPEKTKIVYCHDDRRTEKHAHHSFTFLSYTFQPRSVKSIHDKSRKSVVVFSGAISQAAKQHIRKEIQRVFHHRWNVIPLTESAKRLNPKIRGWINYYAKLNKYKAHYVFCYLNMLIRKWIKNTYKLSSEWVVCDKLKTIREANPMLFYHWQLGIIK